VAKNGQHAIAHNKVMVIDGLVVITGSFNFTTAAERQNAENLLIIRDPAVAGRYAENWQTHAPRRSVADFRTTPDNARKSLGRPVCHKTLTSQPFLPGPPLAVRRSGQRSGTSQG
jgi:phosphatidylserine/phosphatidylglycerophosphate/cardiolipin synthase-like enzyme